MTIKEVETLTGITRQNIRFYEKKGLLAPQRKVPVWGGSDLCPYQYPGDTYDCKRFVGMVLCV